MELTALAPGGHLVVTRFDCPSLAVLFVLRCMHIRVKREVKRKVPGFMGVTTLVHWRARTMYSISMWRDLDEIYGMGEVARHIHAARMPAKLGTGTSAGIFTYIGDWRRVLFRTTHAGPSPITQWRPSAHGRPASTEEENDT